MTAHPPKLKLCKDCDHIAVYEGYCSRCAEEMIFAIPTHAYDESLGLFVGACMLVATAAVVAAFAIPMGWLS